MLSCQRPQLGGQSPNATSPEDSQLWWGTVPRWSQKNKLSQATGREVSEQPLPGSGKIPSGSVCHPDLELSCAWQ